MANGEIDTILGDDIQFRGRMQFKQALQINGRFQGKINSAGHLVIGKSANVEADLEVGSVSIEGKLDGNVYATKKVDILKSARLHGDVRTPDLHIESGSRFSGNCIME